MPLARQLCTGSSRLVTVKKYRDDDKSECAFCNAKPKGTRRKHGADLYYEVPAHVADGVRDSSKIDWSNV